SILSYCRVSHYSSSFLYFLRIPSALYLPFFLYPYVHPRDLHSFPTRRSSDLQQARARPGDLLLCDPADQPQGLRADRSRPQGGRSEEHTSELQSRFDLVCRLLLEKKKRKIGNATIEIKNQKKYSGCGGRECQR